MKQLRDPIVYPSLVDVVGALHQTENRFDVRNDDEELRDDFGREVVQVSHVGVGRMLAIVTGFEQTRLGRLLRRDRLLPASALALIDLFASRQLFSIFFGFDSLLFPLPGTAGIGLCVRVSALEKVRRAAASFFPSVSRDAALQFHQPPGTISNFDKSRLKTPSAAQNLKKRRRTAKMSEENLKSRVRCGQTPVSLTKV